MTAQPPAPQPYSARVSFKKSLSPSALFIQLVPDQTIPFQPGQFCSWLIDQHRRPLSFANIPTHPTLDFIVGTAAGGVCSQYASRLTPGDQVSFLAPYGRFITNPTPQKPILLIATGTGLAPIRSHLHYLLAHCPHHPITLIFGNHDKENLFLHDELTKLSHQHPNFSYIPTLSKSSSTWLGQTKLVTTLAPQLIPNLSHHDIYICGNPNMIKDMTAVLKRHRVPPAQIHTEQYL